MLFSLFSAPLLTRYIYTYILTERERERERESEKERVCMYVCKHTHAHTLTHIGTHTHIHIHIYIYRPYRTLANVTCVWRRSKLRRTSMPWARLWSSARNAPHAALSHIVCVYVVCVCVCFVCLCVCFVFVIHTH
jgi:hypothetical protein